MLVVCLECEEEVEDEVGEEKQVDKCVDDEQPDFTVLDEAYIHWCHDGCVEKRCHDNSVPASEPWRVARVYDPSFIVPELRLDDSVLSQEVSRW